MKLVRFLARQTRETLEIYWLLVRIMVPVILATELLKELGALDFISPTFGPVMALIGLPPELGLAWLTGLLVGLWGAVPIVFTLVPVEQLSTADMTVFSALLLIAHGLPVEQRIIAQAGPSFLLTSLLRLGGGLLYAFMLHHLFAATGWLSQPLAPAWVPMEDATGGWVSMFGSLAETLISMFAILWALSVGLELSKRLGVLDRLIAMIRPVLRLSGMSRDVGPFAAIGLLLGISYGGALLIREARSDVVEPRQIFVACVFMGFAHSIIEDTLVVVALGADIWGVLVGRVAVAIAFTAVVAFCVRALSEESFRKWAFRDERKRNRRGWRFWRRKRVA
ncbi:nucleoside recognition protein [Jiella sp. KSK16Y-1]|uniref:Nucleoside recognition protein n=2 Tax=Jiella mangrovi TaxID=2821407 RepID=A0ABS4BGW0_9HYPH|nr:nucleoside recognition protein [Jiella mangrovi]